MTGRGPHGVVFHDLGAVAGIQFDKGAWVASAFTRSERCSRAGERVQDGLACGRREPDGLSRSFSRNVLPHFSLLDHADQ